MKVVLVFFFFFWLSSMAKCRFRSIGGVWDGCDVTNWQSDRCFMFVFHLNFPSIFCRFDVISAFPFAENDLNTILAARERAKPVLTSPFDPLMPIWCSRPLAYNYTLFLTTWKLKVMWLSDCACKVLNETFGERIVSLISLLHETLNGISLGRSASFDARIFETGWAVRPLQMTKQK